MLTTLEDGDNLWIDKFTYHFKLPERFDIVVFPYQDSDTLFIKRVIGLPGEKLEIKHDNTTGIYRVYINDKPLKEDYIMSEFDFHPCKADMYCGPLIIPEGQYFMMGDNRGNSLDSRFWGTLPRERFIGRAVFVFWPLNRVKVLR
jgi:signal peptidase I